MYCLQDFCLNKPFVWALVTVMVVVAISVFIAWLGSKSTDHDKLPEPRKEIILAGQRFSFFPNAERPTPVLEILSVDIEKWILQCKVVVLIPEGSEVMQLMQGDDSVQLTLKNSMGKVVNQEWILDGNYPTELYDWQVYWSKVEEGS